MLLLDSLSCPGRESSLVISCYQNPKYPGYSILKSQSTCNVTIFRRKKSIAKKVLILLSFLNI